MKIIIVNDFHPSNIDGLKEYYTKNNIEFTIVTINNPEEPAFDILDDGSTEKCVDVLNDEFESLEERYISERIKRYEYLAGPIDSPQRLRNAFAQLNRTVLIKSLPANHSGFKIVVNSELMMNHIIKEISEIRPELVKHINQDNFLIARNTEIFLDKSQSLPYMNYFYFDGSFLDRFYREMEDKYLYK